MILDPETQVTEIAGMSDTDATDVLRQFCESGFDGSLAQAGLALGRPEQELQRMLNGEEPVDRNLIMKVRGIAQQRDIDIGIQFPDDDEDAGDE